MNTSKHLNRDQVHKLRKRLKDRIKAGRNFAGVEDLLPPDPLLVELKDLVDKVEKVIDEENNTNPS